MLVILLLKYLLFICSFVVLVIADFNMQDETSIPEDIIDQQHLQEIIDKQQQGIQLQQQQQLLQQKYVGNSAALAAATNVLNDDGDIIDVNLPYDDSTDTDSDADIVSSIRSFL